MCIAAAVLGAAAIGAAGSAIAGGEAASATREASNAAIAEQKQALYQQQQLEAPYVGIGNAAIPQYEALLGIGPQGASGIGQALANTPGYQFALSQGEKGIVNAASTQGGVSGNTLSALDQFNVGTAQGTYQQELADVQGAVGIGQAAASGQAANIGNAANNISNMVTSQGNTIAGIDANTVAGISKAASGAGQDYLTMQALTALNNPGG